MVDQTKQEIQIIEEYLPKQLSKEELKAKVQEVIQETGATSMKDMGKVMKAAKEKLVQHLMEKASMKL